MPLGSGGSLDLFGEVTPDYLSAGLRGQYARDNWATFLQGSVQRSDTWDYSVLGGLRVVF